MEHSAIEYTNLTLGDEEQAGPGQPLLACGYPLLIFACSALTACLLRSAQRGIPEKKKAQEPPVLWQFLPFIGSTMELGADILGFIRKYSDMFGSPLFSATILGSRCHFLGNADHVLWSYSHPKLDCAKMHVDFCERAAGIPRRKLQAMFANQKLIKDMNAGFTRHILQRDSLKTTVMEAQRILLRNIERDLQFSDWTEVDLMDFCHTSIVLASTGPFVSEEIANEECANLLKDFDAGVNLIMAGVPSLFLPKFVRARTELLRRLQATKIESPVLSCVRKVLREAGFDDNVNARKMLVFFWAANANSVPAVFWALANLLMDESAQHEVKRQVDGLQKQGSIKDLEDLDRLTALRSVFWETLRLSWGGFTPRVVTEDFELKLPTNGNGASLERWRLRKGTRIMTYPPVVHRDSDVFHDPDTFVYDRFLADDNGKLPEFKTKTGKSIGLSPFGGGAHMCPGRK